MPEISDALLAFLERGGIVLTVILLLSTLMWTLLVERFWYMHRLLPAQLKQYAQTHNSNTLKQRAQLSHALSANLPLIHALVYTLPLLGLLGTVAGMIQTFDVLTVFGTSNPRGMSSGISKALLTTMAGLVTSLSGLFFISLLNHRVDNARHQLIADDEIPTGARMTPLLALRDHMINKPPRTPEIG